MKSAAANGSVLLALSQSLPFNQVQRRTGSQNAVEGAWPRLACAAACAAIIGGGGGDGSVWGCRWRVGRGHVWRWWGV
jgi:hypothetical protein